MMRKSLIVGILILSLAVTASVVWARGGGMMGGGMGPGDGMRGPGYMGQTDCPMGSGPMMHRGQMMGHGGGRGGMMGPGGMWAAQDPKATEETNKLRVEMYQKHLEMQTVMSADKIDEAKAKALQADMNALRAKMADARMNAMIEFRKKNPDWRPWGQAPAPAPAPAK